VALPQHTLRAQYFLWSAGLCSVYYLRCWKARAASDQAIRLLTIKPWPISPNRADGLQQVEDNVAALRILEHEAQFRTKPRAAQKYVELAATRYKAASPATSK